MPAYLSWLENPVHTRSVIGSNPIAGTTKSCNLFGLHDFFLRRTGKIPMISLFLGLTFRAFQANRSKMV